MNSHKRNGINTSVNKHEAIEKLIYVEGLRMAATDYHVGWM